MATDIEHGESRAETGRGDGAVRPSGHWRETLKDAPFFAASILFHSLLIFILGLITVAAGQARRAPVISLAEIVDLPDDFIPPRAEDVEAIADPGSAESLGAAPAVAESDLPDIEMEDVDQIALRAPIASGDTVDSSASMEHAMKRYGHSEAGSLSGAVDLFAVETLNSIEKGTTNVVFLVDESPSIVRNDLPIVQKRMASYFKWMRLELKERYADRGRWAIISFGKKAQVRQDLTKDLDKVEEGFSRVVEDRTGVESLLDAVDLCMSRYGGKAKYLLIAAVTDEVGDDTRDDKALERSIRAMQSGGARFFCFGREANWGLNMVRVKIEMTVDGKKKEFDCPADMGPECPRDEYPADNWAWNGGLPMPMNFGSGFGMYALNRMVQETRGMYFLLNRQSNWDMDRMVAYYRPDYCSRAEYDEICARSPLRSHVRKCWNDMHRCPGFGSWSKSDDMRKTAGDLRRHLGALDEDLAILDRILASAPSDKVSPKRWAAHGQLARACLLAQLHNCTALEAAIMPWTDQNQVKVPINKEIVAAGGSPIIPPHAKQRLEALRENVFKACNQVIADHPKTPWAEMAAYVRGCLQYYNFEVRDRPQEWKWVPI
ncbi:MAG TPA: VWA domain-containing protein [Candidatus Brocadiia bacterium]|nr:VWA domain-containing protein [Candidatus Brocadiia bacterium]